MSDLSTDMTAVTIIGGGLAGTEAAWQVANRGGRVRLYEMRPRKMTAAHTTGQLAELVCSNSLGSDDLTKAPGLLKHEMRELGSLMIACAAQATLTATEVNTLFRGAVTYELAGDRINALAMLEKALDRGYSVTEVRMDPELTALRKDVRYHRLIARFERTVPTP